MGLSPLRKHKFDHNFSDTPFATCPTEDGIETTCHFLLLCKAFSEARAIVMLNVTQIIGVDFVNFPNKKKVEVLLYGTDVLSYYSNKQILKETI